MNWFSITMYARARKKGIITSGKIPGSLSKAQPDDKKQMTGQLHNGGRTMQLNPAAVKETA